MCCSILNWLKEGEKRGRKQRNKREGVIITNDFMNEIYQSNIMQYLEVCLFVVYETLITSDNYGVCGSNHFYGIFGVGR